MSPAPTEPPPDAPVQTVATSDLDAFATLQSAEPAPGPGSRVTRTAGQAGGVLAFLDLWHSFGWLGADHWTGEQAAARWPALSAAALVTVSAVHNLVGWWTIRRRLARLAEGSA